MNMNKKNFIIMFVVFAILFICFNINVYADNKTCNNYASQGKEVCENQTYNGKKCAWDGNKKGGARCYDSGKLADETKETITSCSQIKDPETCGSSKIEGHECIWRQNACYDNALVDDGTDETIIADDQNDRDKQEYDTQSGTAQKTCMSGYELKDGKCVVVGYVAENPCDENSIRIVLRMFGYILLIARIAVPLIIIGFGTFDLFKSVIDKDEKSLTKQVKQLGIRVLAGLIVFFIPNIVSLFFSLSDKLNIIETDQYKTCSNCLLKPTTCDVDDIETDTSAGLVDEEGN